MIWLNLTLTANIKFHKAMNRFILSIFSILMFILSVDGTIALRYLLLTILIIFLLFYVKNNQGVLTIVKTSKELKLTFISLLVFILYIF